MTRDSFNNSCFVIEMIKCISSFESSDNQESTMYSDALGTAASRAIYPPLPSLRSANT